MIDSFAPARFGLSAKPVRLGPHLSRAIPIGSVDSTASRILVLRATRSSHRVPSISVPLLRLIQAFGLSTALR